MVLKVNARYFYREDSAELEVLKKMTEDVQLSIHKLQAEMEEKEKR